MAVKFTKVPEQDGLASARIVTLTGNTKLTVTVAVPVNCAEHVPRVAYTLKVVVTTKLPVGKLIVQPVPPISAPTEVLPASLNW